MAPSRPTLSLLRATLLLQILLALLLSYHLAGDHSADIAKSTKNNVRPRANYVSLFDNGPERDSYAGKPYERPYLFKNEDGNYYGVNEKKVWCGDGNVVFPPRRRQLSQRVQMVYIYPSDAENILPYDLGLSIAWSAKDAEKYFSQFSLFDQLKLDEPLPGAKERVLRFNTGTNCGRDWLSIAAVQLPFNSQEAVGTGEAIVRTANWTRQHLIEQGMSPYWNVMIFYAGPLPASSPFAQNTLGYGQSVSAYSIGHDAGGGYGISYCKYEPEKLKRAYANTNERNTGRSASEGFIPYGLCQGGGSIVTHELLHSYGFVYNDSPQSSGDGHTKGLQEPNGYNCVNEDDPDPMTCSAFSEDDIMGGAVDGDRGANSWFAQEVFFGMYPYKYSNLRYIIQNPTANFYYNSILCDVDKCAQESYGDATSPDSHDPGPDEWGPLLGAQYERLIKLGGLCNMFRAQQLCEKAFGPGVVVEDELGNVYPPEAKKALEQSGDGEGGSTQTFYRVRFAANKRPPTLRLRSSLVVRARPAKSSCRALTYTAKWRNPGITKAPAVPIYLRATAGRRTYPLKARRFTVGTFINACRRHRPLSLRITLPRAARKAKVLAIKDGGALLARVRR